MEQFSQLHLGNVLRASIALRLRLVGSPNRGINHKTVSNQTLLCIKLKVLTRQQGILASMQGLLLM